MTVSPEAMNYRKRRPLRLLFVLVALYAAAGFFALPPLIKWQLEKRLPEMLGRPVSVGQVRTNPFALSVAINRVVVRVPDGSATLVGWERFYVNFDPLASITREWVLGDVALAGLDGAIEVRPDGSLNVSDLIEKFRRPAAPGESPRAGSDGRPWRIRRLNITDARLAFADRSRAEPFATAIGPVNLTVLDFRTAGARGAPGRFEAVSDAGEKIAWIGSLTAAPLTSTGELRIENLQLPKYGPYLADRLRGKIGSGRLSVNANYEIDLSPGSRRIAITGGAAQLAEFRLAEAGGEPLGELNSLQVTGLAADALVPRLAVDAIRLEGGRLAVRRAADGTLNLLELLPPSAETPAAPGPTPEVKVKEISLRDFAVSVRDLAGPRPVEAELTRLNGSVKDATLAAGAAMPLDLSFDWAPRGAVRVSGNVMREPLLADLNLEVAWLALPPLSPYLESAAAARIERGAASLSGRARVEQAAADSPFSVAFTGGGRMEDFSLVATEGGGEELAGFGEFSLDDVKLATQPRLTVSIASASLGSPRAHAVRDEQGVLNFSRLRPVAPEGGAAPAGGGGTADADVSVSRVLIAGGEFTFEDRSMQPRVRTALTQLSGTLRNLSSAQPELGSVELRGMVNGAAPVSVIGRLNPLGAQPFADLIVDGKAIDLAPAAPYVSRFAGYELDGGRLAFDVKAKLANDALDMRNTITLERFALGRATPGPDAVKLPVKLGVALLKDADGRIVLDLPVQGSLADPKFDVGAVVGDVFTGLLTKAATSPFALLGSMFGGGGEELAQQEWVPGEATLTEESVRRLVTVQRALAARPALSVEIEAAYHPREDAEAMKRVKLEALLRRELVRESQGRNPSAQARANAIRTVFSETFPSGVSRAEVAQRAAAERTERAPTFAPRGEPVAAPEKAASAEERRGILGRAIDIATLKGPRNWWSERRERKEAEERAAEAAKREAAVAREEASREDARRRAQDAVPPDAALELSVEEMERHLAATIAVTEADLKELAQARGARVRELLLADGAVAPERVAIGAAKAADSGERGARSVLHLR